MGEQPCVQPPQGRPGKGRGQAGRDQYQLRHQLSVQPTCAVSPVPGMAGYTASTRAQYKCHTHTHAHTHAAWGPGPAPGLWRGNPSSTLMGTDAMLSHPPPSLSQGPWLSSPTGPWGRRPPDTGHLHRTPWGPLPAQLPSSPCCTPASGVCRHFPPLHISLVGLSMNTGTRPPGSNRSSAASELCTPGQVALPLCASV